MLQSQCKVDVQVVGLKDSYTNLDLPAWSPLTPVTHRVQGPRAIGYSSFFFDSLIQSDADLAYCVGLWKYPSLAAFRWARRTGKPFMVGPHGMLDPWALRNSGTKKRMAGWLFQDNHLHEATCIRALCKSEAESIRAYGLKNPIAIIPNGIDLIQNENELIPPWFGLIAPARKVLLFLSRIHPKKGLVQLLKAWATLQNADEWVLVIAGWDQGEHENELKRLATELRIPWHDIRSQDSRLGPPPCLLFLGPQFGNNKAACYRHCHGFILPSLSEGLPMVILEAWAYAKPVLMTRECNLSVGFDVNAALCLQPDSMSHGIKEFLMASENDLRIMGQNGLELVKRNYAWEQIGPQMRTVYEWMLGGGGDPDCFH